VPRAGRVVTWTILLLGVSMIVASTGRLSSARGEAIAAGVAAMRRACRCARWERVLGAVLSASTAPIDLLVRNRSGRVGRFVIAGVRDGQPFVARGANYIHLGYTSDGQPGPYRTTFNSDAYDPARADRVLARTLCRWLQHHARLPQRRLQPSLPGAARRDAPLRVHRQHGRPSPPARRRTVCT
jgi:hypothetical protein